MRSTSASMVSALKFVSPERNSVPTDTTSARRRFSASARSLALAAPSHRTANATAAAVVTASRIQGRFRRTFISRACYAARLARGPSRRPGSVAHVEVGAVRDPDRAGLGHRAHALAVDGTAGVAAVHVGGRALLAVLLPGRLLGRQELDSEPRQAVLALLHGLPHRVEEVVVELERVLEVPEVLRLSESLVEGPEVRHQAGQAGLLRHQQLVVELGEVRAVLRQLDQV